MPISSFIFSKDPKLTKILDASGNPTLVVDCTTKIMPHYGARVTKHAVEGGGTISDHVELENLVLSVSGVVSDSPLSLSAVAVGLAQSALAGQIAGGANVSSPISQIIKSETASIAALIAARAVEDEQFASKAREFLKQKYNDREPFTMVTNLEKHESMVITSLDFPQNGPQGKSCFFDLTMEQIEVVNSETTAVPESIVNAQIAHSAASKTDVGAQTAKQAGAKATKNVSLLEQGARAIEGTQ